MYRHRKLLEYSILICGQLINCIYYHNVVKITLLFIKEIKYLKLKLIHSEPLEKYRYQQTLGVSAPP
jgi:hypothetical protein